MRFPPFSNKARSSRALRRRTRGGHVVRPALESLELRALLASLHLIGTGVSVVSEGKAFTSQELIDFSDSNLTSKPGDFTTLIDWGDGTPKDSGSVIRGPSQGYEVLGGHTYQQEGSYNVEVAVVRNSNGSDFVFGTPSEVVNNGALVGGTPVALKATQGVAMANVLVAGFTDAGLPDPVGQVPSTTIQGVFQSALTGKALPNLNQVFPNLLGQYTATINWGDGTAPTSGTVQLVGSNFSVSGTHAYAKPGNYSISATVADRGVDEVALLPNAKYVTSGDFNGDGRTDLVYSQIKRSASGDELDLITLINQTDGTFAQSINSPSRFTYPFYPYSGGSDDIRAHAADLDLNGTQDLVVSVYSSTVPNTTFVTYNQGGAKFISPSIVNVQSGSVKDVAIARLAGDTYPSVILATEDQSTSSPQGYLQVYKNPSGTIFTASGAAITLGYTPDSVKVGDFNGDGRGDVAVVGTKDNGGASFIGVFETRLGLAGSGFGSPISQIQVLGGNPIITATSDANGDGLKDFTVYGRDNARISVLLSKGNGTFGQAPGSPVDLSPFINMFSDSTSLGNLDLGSIGQALDVVLPAIRTLIDPTGLTDQTDLDTAMLLQEPSFTSYFKFEVDAVGDFNKDGLIDILGHPTAYNFIDYGLSTLPAEAYPTAAYLLQGTSEKTTFKTTARVAARSTDDFDGDGKTDLAVYLPNIGAFGIRPSAGGPDRIIPFGTPGTNQSIPVPGDYDGDGKDDLAVYLPNIGDLAIRPSAGGPDQLIPFGSAGPGMSIPAPGDYFGTGQTDVAVYLPASGYFALRTPDGRSGALIPFGSPGTGQSIPAPGDYDGDGKTDLAVYLPALGDFGIRPSGGGPDRLIPFGAKGTGQSIPAPGDYDGDGKTDLAVYLPTNGLYAYRPSGGGADVVQAFGASGSRQTLPAPGNYAGGGRDQVAAYIPAYGSFLIRTVGQPDRAVAFGSPGAGQTLPVTKVIYPTLNGPTFRGSSFSIPIPDDVLASSSTLQAKKKK